MAVLNCSLLSQTRSHSESDIRPRPKSCKLFCFWLITFYDKVILYLITITIFLFLWLIIVINPLYVFTQVVFLLLVIRPVFEHPHTRNWKKSDPVAKYYLILCKRVKNKTIKLHRLIWTLVSLRYFQYKQEWEMFKPPGEKSRKELHWAIRVSAFLWILLLMLQFYIELLTHICFYS